MAEATTDERPAIINLTIQQWLKQNLFSSWFNSLLTVACVWFIYTVLSQGISWAVAKAEWAVVQANLRLFLVGRYPIEQFWRLWLVLLLTNTLAGLSWGILGRFARNVALVIGTGVIALVILLPGDLSSKFWLLGAGALIFGGFFLGQKLKFISGWLALIWLLALPVMLWLISGGGGLTTVDSNAWNGLLLTILIAVLGIVLSFPLGVLLALGRQSTLPVIHWFSVIYIEVMRGLPVIGILFMAQVMLPLFFPSEVRVERVVRAIAGFVLFSSAYLAENVRGGLQSIPRGQTEAAKALGLNSLLITLLIVLPQALKAVIPTIVGQFIGLFKDTSLVVIVGLVDLMGISRSILAQPDFLGHYTEVYLFLALIYWIFCYSMSLGSRRLEKTLDTN